MRILVVEDSERLGRSLMAGLEAAGHDVEIEADGLAGYEAAREKRHDLILLDLLLPGMSGDELLAGLRDERIDTPVLIVSARDTAEDRIRGLRSGADDYLVKPFVFEELLARVEALGRRHSSGGGRGARQASGDALDGLVVDGRYRLESAIGHGGFATVYRAEHLGLGRKVAVKVLSRRALESNDGAKRFAREGISACRVDHPNAVSVFDSGVLDDGLPYLVMELLEGRTLSAEISAAGPFSPRRCGELLGPLCDVLATAHQRGVIHRDVKPDNVFVHRQAGVETVKVLDFGLAKWLWHEDGSEVTMLHTADQLIGTLPYLAPERVRSEAYDGASDVYSLAAVVYEMLCGELPFPASGSPYALLRAICFDDPPPLDALVHDLPPGIGDLVTRGLAKDPRARPSARALWREYRAALA